MLQVANTNTIMRNERENIFSILLCTVRMSC